MKEIVKDTVTNYTKKYPQGRLPQDFLNQQTVHTIKYDFAVNT